MVTSNHGKKTPQEISDFRSLAEQVSNEHLRRFLVEVDDPVPEYEQVVRDILLERDLKEGT